MKTVRFADPKYVGDPINAVKIFNEKRVDELIVLDIDATAKGLEPNYQMIEHLAVECRMPLCYGGGIHTVRQAQRIVQLGVEKIALSSAAVAQPSLIRTIAEKIGCQSVVVVLDVKRASDTYEVYTHNGTQGTSCEPAELAVQMEASGAGEIVLNSIDNDGVMGGYDFALADSVRSVTTLPLTILGGAGSLDHIRALIRRYNIVGAAAGSLFVFKGPYRAVLINYPNSEQKKDLIAQA